MRIGIIATILVLTAVSVLTFGCAQVVDTTTTTTTTTSVTGTTLPSTVAAPTFSQTAGTHEANTLSVTMETTTPSAEIYYTTDGAIPTQASTLYTGAVSLSASATLQAVATLTGVPTSSVTSATYWLKWWQAFGGLASGDAILTLAKDSSGNIYVGGMFSAIGGVTTDNIARYNISTGNWEALGDGLDSVVYDLAITSGGDLIAGGAFAASGATTLSCIARWNGSTWSQLDNGLDNTVYAVATTDIGTKEYVLAGGAFSTEAVGGAVNYIGVYDVVDVKWDSAGGGINDTVLPFPPLYCTALCLVNDDLFAGGNFKNTADGAANYVAVYRAAPINAWQALSSGMNHIVATLYTTSSNEVIAGGTFTTAGGVACSKIASWSGSAWTSFGSGFDEGVYGIAEDSSGKLFVCGAFENSGTTPILRIARWNSATGSWEALGSGLEDDGRALLFDNNGNLIVGGDFTSAGGVATNALAKWGIK